jgi:DNA-directed RNA polymerase specialized sigma24 family protein
VIGRHGASLAELEALYRSRFEVFARAATSLTRNPERGRDAVQEAFAIAVSKRSFFRGDGLLEAWVWRIVLNAARSELRRAAGRPTRTSRRVRTATRRRTPSCAPRSLASSAYLPRE